MAKPWDDTFKKLVRMSPQAFVHFLLPSAHFVKVRSYIIEQEELEMDGLLEVNIGQEPMLLHIEFQTKNDATIAERLLRYNVLTRIYHGLPVLSCVIHLLADGSIAPSPLVWNVPVRPKMLQFQYESIELSKLQPDDVLQTQEMVLLPLLPLTKGGDNRQEIQRMFQLIETRDDVNESNKREIGLTAFTLAALILRRKRNDALLEWLIRRFQVMHEVLRESPIFQMIMQEGVEQGLEKGLEQGLEKGRIEEARAMLVYFVEARFPQLKDIAREQALEIESQKILEKLAFAIGSAPTADEAMQSLIAWKAYYKDLL